MRNVGVVIVNYNDSINGLHLFESLRSNDLVSEIVIVDNNSKDEYKNELMSYHDEKLHIIFNSVNKGYSAALNDGAKYLIKKYGDINILFSNTDIKIQNNLIVNHLSSLINDDVSTCMVKVKEDGIFNYGWKITSSFVDLICNIPLINKAYKKKFLYYSSSYFVGREFQYVDVIYGAFFMINASILESIGYFDENTFLYFEENILAVKLKNISKKSVVLLTDQVIHAHNKTIGSNVSRLNKYKIYKKSQFYYEKKYNSANLIEMFFFKFFYYLRLPLLKISCLIKK